MVNEMIKSVESSCLRNVDGEIKQIIIRVVFNADWQKPFWMKILDVKLSDKNGEQFTPCDKREEWFPVGIIMHIKPKFHFQCNGEPLGDGASFSISLHEKDSTTAYRFTYKFEHGIGKLENIEKKDIIIF